MNNLVREYVGKNPWGPSHCVIFNRALIFPSLLLKMTVSIKSEETKIFLLRERLVSKEQNPTRKILSVKHRCIYAASLFSKSHIWIIFFFLNITSFSIAPKRHFNADNGISINSACAVPDYSCLPLLMWACHYSHPASYSAPCEHFLSLVWTHSICFSQEVIQEGAVASPLKPGSLCELLCSFISLCCCVASNKNYFKEN